MNGRVRKPFLSGILVALCLGLGTASGLAAETLRIGVQTTGTFAWQLDVIRRHGLATRAGGAITPSIFRGASGSSGPRWWEGWTSYARN